MCIGAYRKTEERRKKNSRKRSDALAEQKGTKLISEALTNYFLRKGVGYLQLSTRRSPPLSPSLYLFASEAANPPPPPSFVNQLVDRANTLMKKNINQADTGGRGGRGSIAGRRWERYRIKSGRQKFRIHPLKHRWHVKGNTEYTCGSVNREYTANTHLIFSLSIIA